MWSQQQARLVREPLCWFLKCSISHISFSSLVTLKAHFWEQVSNTNMYYFFFFYFWLILRPSFQRSSIMLELDLLLNLFGECYLLGSLFVLFLWFWCWQIILSSLVELLDKSVSVKKGSCTKFWMWRPESCMLSICFLFQSPNIIQMENVGFHSQTQRADKTGMPETGAELVAWVASEYGAVASYIEADLANHFRITVKGKEDDCFVNVGRGRPKPCFSFVST